MSKGEGGAVYEQVTNSCLASAIGPNGLGDKEFRAGLKAAGKVLERLAATKRPDEKAIFDLVQRRDDLVGLADGISDLYRQQQTGDVYLTTPITKNYIDNLIDKSVNSPVKRWIFSV